MASQAEVTRSFEAMLAELGQPPIRLVFASEWRLLAGRGIGSAEGRASRRGRVVTTRYRRRDLPTIETTLWHEVAHILFPHRPHWWIECYAARMTGGPTGRYSQRYRHTPDELPTRAELLVLGRRASRRLRRRVAEGASQR
jgi:hypothetical protein